MFISAQHQSYRTNDRYSACRRSTIPTYFLFILFKMKRQRSYCLSAYVSFLKVNNINSLSKNINCRRISNDNFLLNQISNLWFLLSLLSLLDQYMSRTLYYQLKVRGHDFKIGYCYHNCKEKKKNTYFFQLLNLPCFGLDSAKCNNKEHVPLHHALRKKCGAN